MGVFHNRGDYPMKKFKQFEEEMTATTAVAGAGDDSETVPVHLKKKKKKKPEVINRFKEMRKRWSK